MPPPAKAAPTMPPPTLPAKVRADPPSPHRPLWDRAWAGVLGFLAGCAAYRALALAPLGHAGAAAPSPLPPARATPPRPPPRTALDDASWKCVSMYRGAPVDPKLHVQKASQVGQDATILDIFRHKTGGTFVDLASNDAINLSNSLVLEQQFNWTGVCIEPNPAYAAGYLHRTCRLVQAVVGPKEGERVDFNFRGAAMDGAFGGIEGFDNKAGASKSKTTAAHYTVSVAKILRDFGMPRKIDYMSLDIEGAEAWTFEAFPWDRYTFLTVTVERPRPKLRRMLADHGYTYLCDHGGFGDELWVHETLPRFDEVVHKYLGRDDCARA